MSQPYDIRGSAAQGRDTSPDTTTVKTLSPPAGATAALVTVETTDARMTLDGSAPSATSGHVIKNGQQPFYLPFAKALKWVSTAAANSVVNVTWLSN